MISCTLSQYGLMKGNCLAGMCARRMTRNLGSRNSFQEEEEFGFLLIMERLVFQKKDYLTWNVCIKILEKVR